MISKKNQTNIYNIIVASGTGVSTRELVEETGLSRRSVSYILKNLIDESKIRKMRDVLNANTRSFVYLEIENSKSEYEYY